MLQTARAAGYANVAWFKLAREASGKVMESPLRGGGDCATVRRMRAEDRKDGAGPLPEIEIARFGMHTACEQAA